MNSDRRRGRRPSDAHLKRRPSISRVKTEDEPKASVSGESPVVQQPPPTTITPATPTTPPVKVSRGAGRPPKNARISLAIPARPPPPPASTSSSSSNNGSPGSNLSGLPWQIGQRVEAKDSHGKWYPAKIIDIQNLKLLIHFQRWSSRFDEWFDMDSDLIRMSSELSRSEEAVDYQVNDEVLARWTDSKFYPARITKILNDGFTCHVNFYDGYRKKVKISALEKLPPDYTGDRLPPKAQPKENFTVIDPINHNAFVCDTCKKGFRKESLLLQHIKHYHPSEEKKERRSSSIGNQQQQKHNENARPRTHSSSTITSATVKEDLDGGTSTTLLNTTLTMLEKSYQEQLLPRPLSSLETDVPMASLKRIGTPDQLGGSASKKRKSKAGRRSTTSSPILKRSKNGEFAPSGVPPPQPPSMNPYFYYYEPRTSSASKRGANFRGAGHQQQQEPVLPFNPDDAKKIADLHENDDIDEIVKCVCTIREENGLMVQCELCLSWQHGLCMGFTQADEVPVDGYFCEFCRNPTKRAIKSQRTSYQLNHWLKKALDPVFMPAYYPQYSHQTPLFHHSLNHHHNQPTTSRIVNSFDDEDEEENSYQIGHHSFDSQVQATNLLSAALLDVMRNIHSLNVKMVNDRKARKELRLKKVVEGVSGEGVNGEGGEVKEEEEEDDDDVKDAEIIEKQRRLKECLDVISAKLEKIENEMEAKDAFDIHTSTSTLTAASPENYGQFADMGSQGSNGGDLPSTGGKGDSFIASHNSSNTTYETCLSSTVVKTEEIEEKEKESGGEGTVTTEVKAEASSAPLEVSSDETVISTLNPASVDETYTANDISASTVATEILPSSPKTEVEQEPLENLMDDTSTFALPTTPPVEDQQPQFQEDKLEHNQHNQFQVPSLARLFIPAGLAADTTANDDSLRMEHNHLHPRPTMTHDYLPLGMDDAHLKLEIAYHHKDLKVAREIVMSLK